MESLPTGGRGLDLRTVTVRPTWGAQEHRRWDKLVATHHYLSFQDMFGKGLRHVATLSSTWIALIGWQAGSLKLTARDHWIGRSREQKLRRLHLVTQNSRFVILPGFHVPNLASRVLGLSLRRLSEDMLAAHGFPVLVAETFVDPARTAPPDAPQLRSLFEFLGTVPTNWARQQSENPRQVHQNEEGTVRNSGPPERRQARDIPAISMDGKDIRGASKQSAA